MPAAPEQFEVSVAEDVLDDLRARLRRTRWPEQPTGQGWELGVDVGYLRELCGHWADRYDWRAFESPRSQAVPRSTPTRVSAGMNEDRTRIAVPLRSVQTMSRPTSNRHKLKKRPLLKLCLGSAEIVPHWMVRGAT